MKGACPNPQKHVALSALLVHVLQSFGFQDVHTLIHAMVGTDAFLRPWTAFRDSYLLEPKFNLEALRPCGEDLGTLFGHIIREVNGRSSRRKNQLSQDAGGRSHTVRLFSCLIHEFTQPGRFYDGGQREDMGWLAAACQDLFLLVKLLREEYAHGHGDLMDAIEERYPSKWLSEGDDEEEGKGPKEDKVPKRYEEDIPESDISEYEEPGSYSRSSSSSLVKEKKVAKSQAEYNDPKIYYEGFSDDDDPDIYYEGFTEYESSEETDESEEDAEFRHHNTGTAGLSGFTNVATQNSPATVGFKDVRRQKDDSLAPQPNQGATAGDPIGPHGLPSNSQPGIIATACITEPPGSDLHVLPCQGSIAPSSIPTSKRTSFRMPFLVSDSESGGEGAHEPDSPVRQQEQREIQIGAIQAEEEAPDSPTDPTSSISAAAFSKRSQSSGSIPQIDDDALFVASPSKRPLKPSHSRHAALLNSVPNDPPQPEIPRRSANELGLFLELSERRAPPMLSFFDPSISAQPNEDPFIEEWSYFGNR